MKKGRSRDRHNSIHDREFRIKKVDARKELDRNWKRFLKAEELDE